MSGEAVKWPEAAAKVAERLSRGSLHPQAVAQIDLALRQGHRIAISCSGGSDSLGLLLTVYGHWKEARELTVVIHFNHGVRGAEAHADARFVQEVSRQLGLPFVLGAEGSARPMASETELRAARMRFLRQEMIAAEAAILLTGHQKDDVAETLFLRVARGSGLRGLSAPRPVQSYQGVRYKALRPLLNLGKQEIREALLEARVSWREDSTNAKPNGPRNLLRMNAARFMQEPLWQGYVRGAVEVRERLQEMEELLDWCLLPLKPATEGFAQSGILDLSILKGRPSAVLRYFLAHALAHAGLHQHFGRAAFQRLLDAAQAHRPIRLSAGSGQWIVIEGNQLYLKRENDTPEWPEVNLSKGASIIFPTGAQISSETAISDEALLQELSAGSINPATEIVLALAEGDSLTLRSWREGDRYEPFGAPGSALLSDQFINRKIPRAERRQLPVVLRNGHPVWAPGLLPAENTRVKGTGVPVTRLTYRQPAAG